MEQVDNFEFKVCGAGGDDIFDGYQMAIEAWGDRAEDNNSALLALAYLWRRFGPPWRGSDDHKSLAGYTLTTDDPHVFVTLHLSGCGLALSVGYLAHESIRESLNRPMREWLERYDEWWLAQHPELESWEDTKENQKKINDIYWTERRQDGVGKAEADIGKFPHLPDCHNWRTAGGVVTQVNQAIFDALKELERPVYVRDCAMTIFGRCDDTDEHVEKSRYAGYGIPKDAMDALISEEAT